MPDPEPTPNLSPESTHLAVAEENRATWVEVGREAGAEGVAADPRFVTYAFHSAVLPDDRRVMVYVPAGYEADLSRRYPVFYLHDGQNLFDGKTSYVAG